MAVARGCLYFEVSDETMKTRLLKRAQTSNRVDDNEATIRKRLDTFHQLTEPVIQYCKQKEKLWAVRHHTTTTTTASSTPLRRARVFVLVHSGYTRVCVGERGGRRRRGV